MAAIPRSHVTLLCLLALLPLVASAESNLDEICQGLPCHCYEESGGRRIVDCRNKKLPALPKFIKLVGHEIHSLLLDDNQISVLPSNAFKNLNVKVINLNNNPLSSVSDRAFYDINNVEEVHMRNCTLDVAPHSLGRLSTVKKLDLSRNIITALTDRAFKRLVNLKWLDLSHNKRIQFPDPFTAFNNLTDLEYLDLSYCSLHNLPLVTSIQHVAKLKTVLLKNNSIGTIPSKVLNKSPELQVLDLDNNPVRLANDNVFRGLHKLKELRLGTCDIPRIKKSTFQDQHRLETLTFHHCGVTAIDDEFFSDFTYLTELDIGGNPLIQLTQDLISGLEYELRSLGISDMNIEQFPTDIIASFYELRIVNASGNHISKLNEGAFRGFYQYHTEIYLDDNRISQISDHVAKGLGLPFVLSLRNNNLTDLAFLMTSPCEFARSRVDVSGNPIHCDCEIYSLVQQKNINLVGTCNGPMQYRGIMLAPPFQKKPTMRHYEKFVSVICRKTDGSRAKFEQRYDCGCMEWRPIESIPCKLLSECSRLVASISSLVVAVAMARFCWSE